MANRKKVFQEKLMRRLYPLASKTEKPQVALTNPGLASEKTCVKVKPIRGTVAAGGEGRNKLPQRRVYTVLPPPDGYRTSDGDSATFPQPKSINTEGDPAETRQEESPEPGNGGRRRRRRKRRLHGEGEGVKEEEEEREEQVLGGAGEDLVGPAGGDAKTSKNRRRKEKKRRRKDRLISQGLVPGATAVEFTYQPGPAEKEEAVEEEREGKKLAELLDFLQATWEACISDPPGGVSRPGPVPDAAMQGLADSLTTQTASPADQLRLHRLRALVLLHDPARLKGALEEFRLESTMPPAEKSAVCYLFRYWLTDILPMHSDGKPSGHSAPTSTTFHEPFL